MINKTRSELVNLVLSATTTEEIRLARASLHSWIAEHPRDRESLRDAFEQLANLEEATAILTRERVATS